jgi:hypothetical protein
MRMRLIAILALAASLGAQRIPFPGEDKKNDIRLPSGKSQRQEIIKAEHEKSKNDAGELLKLAQELKEELDDSPHQVVNLRLVKKAEDIERLARNIKNRMKRY